MSGEVYGTCPNCNRSYYGVMRGKDFDPNYHICNGFPSKIKEPDVGRFKKRKKKK